MTGTVQRTICCFHLCQLALKCAQLPQPATVGAVGRSFAEQWIISPFWFGAVWTPALICSQILRRTAQTAVSCRETAGREKKWETELAISWRKRICSFRNVSFVSLILTLLSFTPAQCVGGIWSSAVLSWASSTSLEGWKYSAKWLIYQILSVPFRLACFS